MVAEKSIDWVPFRGVTARKTCGSPSPVATRLRWAGYFADVLADANSDAIYHWMIQKGKSAQVLDMGQEESFALALARARKSLEGLVMRSKAQRPHSLHAVSGARRP